MFRTYAAWVRGATEADVAMTAMNRKKSVADCTCSQEALAERLADVDTNCNCRA